MKTLGSHVPFALFLIFAVAVSRILPHPPNVAPAAALALFGGRYFSSRWIAFMIVAAAMLLSDLFIGFHDQMLPVYGSLALSVILGSVLRNRHGAISIATIVLLNSVVFFAATNFGVWLVTNMYPHTAAGLAACFTAALPFFERSLMGDVFYSALLFGGVWAANQYLVREQEPEFVARF
jgi:hypothetical protein